jgi:ribosomal protein S27E
LIKQFKNEILINFSQIKMDLYSLNKDMLVYLVTTIQDDTLKQMSNDDLYFELERREKERIVKSLLRLKFIPYLKELIEKYENNIINMKTKHSLFIPYKIRTEFEKYSLHNITSKYNNLYYDLNFKDTTTWLNTDKIEFFSCINCNNHEIFFYKDGILTTVEYVYNDQISTDTKSNFVESKCIDCQ